MEKTLNHLVLGEREEGDARAFFLYEGESDPASKLRLRYEVAKEASTILTTCFHGKFLEVYPFYLDGRTMIAIGLGKQEEEYPFRFREAAAVLSARCEEQQVKACEIAFGEILETKGEKALSECALGLLLGNYHFSIDQNSEEGITEFRFSGLQGYDMAEDIFAEATTLAQDICWVRDMVNLPGNMLHPMDFERQIGKKMQDAPLQMKTIVYGQMKTMGMQALYGIGGSSEFPPCMVVLRYDGAPNSKETYGFIGKGITCDSGGYCLKSAGSMAGIKGDMAGAAAVAAMMHSVAERNLPVNLVACLPMAENRISQSALLPGDVITGYGGKTIEILNTDAEGRLVLSDAISYAIKDEGVTKILDIATLTGAAWAAFGYTIGASLSDNDDWYAILTKALVESGERFVRLPYGREHEKMIDSKVADVKNTGSNCCGTITAGLFLHRFTEGLPWIHLDIAGTAWAEEPNFAFEERGATGAGMLSMYYMMKQCAKES